MITSGFGLAVGISLIVVDQHVLQMQVSIANYNYACSRLNARLLKKLFSRLQLDKLPPKR